MYALVFFFGQFCSGTILPYCERSDSSFVEEIEFISFLLVGPTFMFLYEPKGMVLIATTPLALGPFFLILFILAIIIAPVLIYLMLSLKWPLKLIPILLWILLPLLIYIY